MRRFLFILAGFILLLIATLTGSANATEPTACEAQETVVATAREAALATGLQADQLIDATGYLINETIAELMVEPVEDWELEEVEKLYAQQDALVAYLGAVTALDALDCDTTTTTTTTTTTAGTTTTTPAEDTDETSTTTETSTSSSTGAVVTSTPTLAPVGGKAGSGALNGGGSNKDPQDLAYTGTDGSSVGLMLGIGAAAVAAGVGLVLWRRKRSSSSL